MGTCECDKVIVSGSDRVCNVSREVQLGAIGWRRRLGVMLFIDFG